MPMPDEYKLHLALLLDHNGQLGHLLSIVQMIPAVT